MDMIIRNGTVVTAGGRRKADISVKDGKIASIDDTGNGIDCAQTVDAEGLLVLPGAIDAHTHFELPFGGKTLSADDFFTGTCEAACGGVTTVIDFVTPLRGENLVDALEKRRLAADGKVCIDYALHMSLIEMGDDTKAQMKAAQEAGVTGFKLFMTYDFRLNDDDFYKALLYSKDISSLIMVHAEAHDPIEARKAEFISQGKLDAWHHYLSRDEAVEAQGVIRAIELAEKAEAPLYIVHLACAEGLAAVEAAQKRGSRIFAETCPQYLHFTNDVYKRMDAHNFVCSPPMKDTQSRDTLLQGIKSGGGISTVATDHCPFMLAEKAQFKDDFTKIPNGVMGTGVFYPYMLSLAGHGHISFERAVELCCENPARIFGLDGRKGTLAEGMDADIVLYDPCRDFTISQENSHSAADYTIWEGVQLRGYPVQTYSRGELVYEDGKFCGTKGKGKFVGHM